MKWENRELTQDMTLEEQKLFYYETLDRVINNPRFYLDHLEDNVLVIYKCSFLDYSKKR